MGNKQMTDRNQQLIADPRDGPLSSYEWAHWQDCENCYFGNLEIIEIMKELQELKEWKKMSSLRGWCNYAFSHTYKKNTKPWTCKDWQKL